jgi:integrase
LRTQVLTESTFSHAAEAWLETRKPYIGPRTYTDYSNYIKTLGAFFSEVRLPEIDSDQIRAYQKMRMARAGASIINHECSVLQQMLKRIGHWANVKDDYQPLKLPKESPHRALTVEEEDRLYRIGASNPAWDVAFCTFVISINTTAGPGELRHIRLMDLHLDDRYFYVQPQGAKRDSRIRTIPLNDAAMESMGYLHRRALNLGCSAPHHYLLPFRAKRGTYDPTRPCKGWRTALEQMLGAADIDVSAYSFRHHALTKLLENPEISEKTAEAIAGHISEKMKNRYAHIRMDIKRQAVEALQRIGKKR